MHDQQDQARRPVAPALHAEESNLGFYAHSSVAALFTGHQPPQRRPPLYDSMNTDSRFSAQPTDPRRGYPSAPDSNRLDALATAAIQQYPIKVGAIYRQGGVSQYDPLRAGIEAVGRELPGTLLPLLRSARDGSSYSASSRYMPETKPSLPPIGSIRDMSSHYLSPLSTPSPIMSVKPEVEKAEPEFKTSFQFVVNETGKEARKTVRKHVMKEFRRRERWEQGGKAPPRERKPNATPTQKRRRKVSVSPIESDSPASEAQAEPSPNPSPRLYEVDDKGQALIDPHKRRRLSSPSDSSSLQTFGTIFADDDAIFDEARDEANLPYRADPWAAVAQSQVDPFSKFELDCGPATQALLHHCTFAMRLPTSIGGLKYKRHKDTLVLTIRSCLGHAQRYGRASGWNSVSSNWLAVFPARSS